MMVSFYPFKHPLQQELGRSAVVVEPILALQPFFAIWMLYQAIRYEAKPQRYVLLAAFVPFSCVWYYGPWASFDPFPRALTRAITQWYK
jgi:hypothetical protein